MISTGLPRRAAASHSPAGARWRTSTRATSALLCFAFLSSCSTFIDSRTYEETTPVAHYAATQSPPNLELEISTGTNGEGVATALGSFDVDAAAMLIRRRHIGLYENPAVLVNYLYAVLEEMNLYERLGAGLRTDFPGGIAEAHTYFAGAWAHSQQSPQFDGFPGDDPWGRTGRSAIPEYKKLLPSEMIAMAMYTGRVTGKCTTLAAAMCAMTPLVSSSPLDPDNIVFLRRSGHTLALWRMADGTVVVLNNNHLDVLGPAYAEYLQEQHYSHFFGYGYYAEGDIRVPAEVLTGDSSLREMFATTNGVDPAHVERDPILVDYALQKLSVPDPWLYVSVSSELPHTQRLARRLKTLDCMLGWMRDNLSTGSIFPDCNARVMTSDQVIVFKTGNALDKAILLCALLMNRGQNPSVTVSDDQILVHVGQTAVDMDSLQIVSR